MTWDEMEPYFTQYEKQFGIAGKAGNLNGEIIEGGNPFEGPRSEEYPQAPGKKPYGATLFKRRLRAARAASLPAAERQQPRRPTTTRTG